MAASGAEAIDRPFCDWLKVVALVGEWTSMAEEAWHRYSQLGNERRRGEH